MCTHAYLNVDRYVLWCIVEVRGQLRHHSLPYTLRQGLACPFRAVCVCAWSSLHTKCLNRLMRLKVKPKMSGSVSVLPATTQPASLLQSTLQPVFLKEPFIVPGTPSGTLVPAALCVIRPVLPPSISLSSRGEAVMHNTFVFPWHMQSHKTSYIVSENSLNGVS